MEILYSSELTHESLAGMASRSGKVRLELPTTQGNKQVEARVNYGDGSGTLFHFHGPQGLVGGYKVPQQVVPPTTCCGFLYQ
jgi:hypothetical protein